jgi:RNA recognition motif-containing protein
VKKAERNSFTTTWQTLWKCRWMKLYVRNLISKGTKLTLQISKNRQQKKPKPKKQQQPKGKPVPGQKSLASVADKLVVSNLATTVTQNDVRELFARIGT